MPKHLFKLVTLTFLATILLGIFGCSKREKTAELNPLKDRKFTVPTSTATVTEPFSFIDGSQRVVGFELASHIAQEMGMTLEVVNVDFGAIIPALISSKVDLIAACITITITNERAEKCLFSKPYYAGGLAALVRE